jgi:hypothetical protein
LTSKQRVILVVAAALAVASAQPVAAQVPLPWPPPTTSPKPTSKPTPTPTPNPYRSLEFGTPTLGGEPAGKLAVYDGWVAVRRDGRGAQACVSFKNEASVTATRVLFEFPILDHSGTEVTVMKLDRRGTFSPGIDIRSWNSMAQWQKFNHRLYAENCTSVDVGVAALPLLKARFATYHILRVEYADGTSWIP